MRHGNSYRSVRRAMVARVERLEPRMLLSGASSITLVDGILTIVGTDGDDRINLNMAGTDGSYLSAVTGQTVELADVRGIRMYGLGGDDFLAVWRLDNYRPTFDCFGTLEFEAAAFDIPVTLYGGDGDDQLISESSGDDLIVGGAGFDSSMASEGRDLYSVEHVERYLGIDVAGEHCDTFMWREVGDRVYADPFENPNANGSYAGVSYPQPEPVTDDTDPSPVFADDGRRHDFVAKPTVEPVASAVEAPAIVAPPRTVFLSAKPISADDLWDDAK